MSGKVGLWSDSWSPKKVPRFLELISQARDRGIVGRVAALWTCEVEIDVVDGPPFKFAISGTDVGGVQLGSKYGTLRNDDLGPFVQAMLRGKRKDPSTQSD